MASRALSLASRSIQTSTQFLPPRIQQRFASSSSQPSPMSNFYKSFTRPVAKVFLMAMFTYQLAYWGWVKLEQDEIIEQRDGQIAGLEAEVKRLTKS